MKINTKNVLLIMFILVFSLSTLAFAEFPEKEVKIIVPWSAGGSTDIITRGMQEAFEDITGQPLVVSNVGGGASTVGMTKALTYEANGYNLIMNASAFAVGHHMGMVDFDYTAFDNIANISWEPLSFVVKKDSPWDNINDLIEYAKENPNVVTIGIGGAGSLAHMTAAGIEEHADVDLNIIPFGGNAPAKAAMLGGHVSVATLHPSEYISQYQAGEVKVLGVATEVRSSYIPDAPTFKEQGVNFAWDDQRWVAAPAGVPDDRIDKLEEIFKKVTEHPSFRDLANDMNFEITFMGKNELENKLESLFKDVGEIAENLDI